MANENNKDKSDIDSEVGLGILIAFFLLAIAFLWGNYDKKSQVMSPELKDLLSDGDNTDALVGAIENEKNDGKSEEFTMGGKKYRIRRAGQEAQVKA